MQEGKGKNTQTETRVFCIFPSMNQDMVKEKLLLLEEHMEEFSVIFSGKQSKKVNGLYYPETREIILHNKNFTDDTGLMYTAIHEFAHHVHFCRAREQGNHLVSNRAHTVEFRAIFHDLLQKAEAMGLYVNKMQEIQELQELAEQIKQKFLKYHGELAKDFGQALMEAEKLCRQFGVRFEDFVERVLCMPRQTAGTMMKMKALDLPEDLGYENMKTLTAVRNPQVRNEAIEAFQKGLSTDQVKQGLKEQTHLNQKRDPVKQLLSEKKRIEKSLSQLNKRLEELELQLQQISDYNRDDGGEAK